MYRIDGEWEVSRQTLEEFSLDRVYARLSEGSPVLVDGDHVAEGELGHTEVVRGAGRGHRVTQGNARV